MINFKRWIPTFLAFPAGGLLAMGVVGSLEGPVSAAAGGLLAGAVIGAAQWLALRTPKRWIGLTAGAMVAGLIAGAAVGAAQGTVLGATAAWTAITSASWSLAWLVTYTVIGVNADQGFYVFGSSGALVATLVTGLALHVGSRRLVVA
jgi:hypothetical protein